MTTDAELEYVEKRRPIQAISTTFATRPDAHRRLGDCKGSAGPLP